MSNNFIVIRQNLCFLKQTKNSDFLVKNFYFYIRRDFYSNKTDCVIRSLNNDHKEIIITKKHKYFLITYSYNEGYTRKCRVFHIPIDSKKIFSHDDLFDKIFNAIDFNHWYEILDDLNLEQTKKILKTTHGL